MDKKVLVTGVGGNVGQGILRNIRKTDYPVFIVGCNIENFSAGNHLCDAFYKVPYAYEEDYISSILHIVETENIDLIIPSTDFEVYYLSINSSKFNATIAASDEFTTEIYLDKYLTYLHHKEHNIPFAETCLPSEFKGQYKEYIAKPRQGRGSRGIFINPKELNQFSDKDYLIQKLLKGQEITTAFYVTKDNKLHGNITLERNLVNGATNDCRVVFEYDQQLVAILEKIIKNSHIKGSANLQSIVTADGDIIPFEVNCRISGTNSIRSNFGFEDVKYTLQEYLFNEVPEKPCIIKGLATRILIDVIYPNAETFEDCVHSKNYLLF
ncbi:carbamoyl phosphate synthase [Bacteroidia bacterium]|nr:carbamoyl phosphate synthase [Bacteroidia bacterium]